MFGIGPVLRESRQPGTAKRLQCDRVEHLLQSGPVRSSPVRVIVFLVFFGPWQDLIVKCLTTSWKGSSQRQTAFPDFAFSGLCRHAFTHTDVNSYLHSVSSWRSAAVSSLTDSTLPDMWGYESTSSTTSHNLNILGNSKPRFLKSNFLTFWLVSAVSESHSCWHGNSSPAILQSRPCGVLLLDQ